MILSSFEMLRPASRTVSQVQLWENIWNDEYVRSYRRFDRWAAGPRVAQVRAQMEAYGLPDAVQH